MYIGVTSGVADFRRQKLLKHPQNPYSIERACHKLSKTSSHALIDAVGGSNHHSECATRALSGPNSAGRGKAGPQGLIRGRGSSAPEQILDHDFFQNSFFYFAPNTILDTFTTFWRL